MRTSSPKSREPGKRVVLPRVSGVQTALGLVFQRFKDLFRSRNPERHLTLRKVAKGLLGFVPVAIGAHYLGYSLSNRYHSPSTDFSQFVIPLESEDQIYSFLDQGKAVITLHTVPGELLSEVMTPEFNKAAYHHSHLVHFVKVNCARHASFCRSRKITHFPWLEIYLPPFPRTFDNQMRLRLLKDKGKYSVCPYKSDLSATGITVALQELDLLPRIDPHMSIKAKLAAEFFERVAE